MDHRTAGVFLDIASRRDAEFIRRRLPSMYHQFKELADVDITAEPMEVGPTCHYVMGGVEVDPDTEESIVTGLYAAGEVAGGMHGSNRLGGNSLSDLLVFGRRAGHNAAYYAHRLQRPAVPQVADGRHGPRPPRRGPRAVRDRGGGENPYTIQKDLQDVMQRLVGIIRKAEELRESLDEIERLKERAKHLAVEGHRQYNPGWHLAIDLTQHADRLRVHREGGAGARGVPRRAHPRRLPRPRRRAGARSTWCSPWRRRLRPRPRRPRAPAAAGDARRARAAELFEDLMGYDLKMRVWRGDASGGELGDYTVEVEEGEVVLDAIHRLQATQAGDLAVRWNCKAGKCGSCSAEVNGRPRLMCMTRLSDFEPRPRRSPSPRCARSR